ncbi:MAG TPA: circadian clock protein KaiC, partial [Adhaeribacter sp.]|nr:circadian clock protein KaiC [Adhaeribacter sp.]
LRSLGVTSVLTTERTKEYGKISRFGVEEFLMDNVIILRNVLSDEKRRRTIEILKFRGHTNVKGETPFTIVPDQAIVIIPLSVMGQKHRSLKTRVSSGVPKLDEMCGGGFYHDSVILVSGSTGAGKTLLVSSYVTGLKHEKERSLLIVFEESTEQLHRNAKGWGKKFVELEKEGLLKIVSIYPESSSLEDHFINIEKTVKEFKPTRVAIDSLTTLVRNSTEKGFREFILALTSLLKQEEVTVMFTATPPTLTGGISNTEDSISSITDTIILLRYVEMSGEMQRSISVLKLRGSEHDTAIRRFTIDNKGMEIGAPFEGVSGILTGNQVIVMEGKRG